MGYIGPKSCFVFFPVRFLVFCLKLTSTNLNYRWDDRGRSTDKNVKEQRNEQGVETEKYMDFPTVTMCCDFKRGNPDHQENSEYKC